MAAENLDIEFKIIYPTAILTFCETFFSQPVYVQEASYPPILHSVEIEVFHFHISFTLPFASCFNGLLP